MSHMSPCAWIPACVPQCMSSHSNRRPYITRTAERKEEPPNTSAWWKQLFTIRQLFTFPAYWMSSGGYRSFAECIISRWTSRLALILGNGRNVESTVETHIHTIYEAAAVAAKELRVCRYLLPSTFCLRFSMSACTYLYQYILYVIPAYRRVCDFYESLCLLAVLLVWASYVARIPLWPYPCFSYSHEVPVNACLSAQYVQLQETSWMTLFVLL